MDSGHICTHSASTGSDGNGNDHGYGAAIPTVGGGCRR